MHRDTTHRPCRTVCTSWHNVLGSVDRPHANTVADIAARCAALDYGYAAWFSHQVDVVVRATKKVTLLPRVGSRTTTVAVADVAPVLADIARPVA